MFTLLAQELWTTERRSVVPVDNVTAGLSSTDGLLNGPNGHKPRDQKIRGPSELHLINL